MPPSSAQEIQAVQARIQKLKLLAVARQQAKTVAANLDKISDKVQQQQLNQNADVSHYHQWNALGDKSEGLNTRSVGGKNRKLLRGWTYDETSASTPSSRCEDSLLLRRATRKSLRSNTSPDHTDIKKEDSTDLLRCWTYTPDRQEIPPASTKLDDYDAARKEFDFERKRMIESDVYEEETLKFQSARKAANYADRRVSEKIASALEDEEKGRGNPNFGVGIMRRVRKLRWATSM